MNTNMTGFRWLSKVRVLPCAYDKSSHSIGSPQLNQGGDIFGGGVVLKSLHFSSFVDFIGDYKNLGVAGNKMLVCVVAMYVFSASTM